MRAVLKIGQLQVRINLLIAVSVVLTVALLINLGLWQLGRAQDKRELQQAVKARQLEPALPIASLSLADPVLDEMQRNALENQNVEGLGSYWNEASFLVAFQFFQGAPGFELITPFQLSNTGEWVLVSRGWIAPGPGDDAQPTVIPIDGEITITGQLHVPAPLVGSTQVQGQEWPLRFRRLDIPLASQVLERALLPVIVRLGQGEQGVLARHWPAMSVSTRNNIGYALQWFGMALVVLVISALMSTNLLSLMAQRSAQKKSKRNFEE